MGSVTTIETKNATAIPGAALTASIPVEGMTCASCVSRVEKAIRAVPGVTSASVNLATERADVRFDGTTKTADIVKAIENSGYGAAEESIELAIEGMTCASCVARIEKALKAVPGVTQASVNLATERASVRLTKGIATSDSLEQAVRAAGYDARRITGDESTDEEAEKREREAMRLSRSLLIAAALTLPIFVLEMGSHFIPAVHDFVMINIGMEESWYLQFVLTTLVLFGPGLRFYQKGIPALLRLAPDMNSLVAIGTAAAWG